MLSPSTLQNGQEQHEAFKHPTTKKVLVQYDYRHTDGRLFSCVKLTLEECQQARHTWAND